MKKAICLIVALIMIFCMCACGDTNTTNNDNNGNSQSDTGADNSSSQNETIDINTKEAYVAKWVHERTDAEPYSMNLTLNADGTGASGKSGGIEWIFDEATKQATVTIIYPDGSKSEPTTAKLTDQNTLVWNNKFNILLADDSVLKLEQVVLKRS